METQVYLGKCFIFYYIMEWNIIMECNVDIVLIVYLTVEIAKQNYITDRYIVCFQLTFALFGLLYTFIVFEANETMIYEQ